MRKSSLLLIIFCLLFTTSFTPKSTVDNDANLTKVERLYLTCKIWGFMKYYHPKVGTGVYDMDDKLLKILSNTNNIQTYDQLNTYMYRWIHAFGPRKPCASCKRRNNNELFLKNFDLSWTQSSKFSNELKQTFKDIERNRFEGNHHYVEKGNAKQFEPKNEPDHLDLNWTDENQRLLPLFRYWNYIEYFFPYKYQTDQDWDEVLKEMIPKFLSAENKLDFHLAMLEMVVKVDDSRAGLISSTLNQMPYYNYLPARIDLIEGQVVVTEIIDEGKAMSNNLKVGDVIKTINGQPAIDLHNSHKQYIWGSNESVKDRSVFHTLFMGLKEAPRVTIERNGSVRNDQLTLYRYSDISYKKNSDKVKWTVPSDSIGYINLDNIGIREVDAMMRELMDMNVLIFDVRNSPKGTYKAIAKYLKPTKTVFAKLTLPDYTYPGKFIWQGESTCGEENPDYFKGKVLLLVNENTQSHAEFTCMCLQTAPDVVIIGSQTAGTDGEVSNFPLYAQLNTAMTGMGVFYPDGRETQRIGIVPDIYVKPTIAGIRSGKDDVLDKAMEVAKDELARLQEIARLEEQAKLDSIRMNSFQMDSLMSDTLRVENEGDY